MAKQKLYNVLKKYNDNHVLDTEKQKENNASLVDFETFAALPETKVNELVNSVKENVNVGNLSFALGSLGGSTIAQKKDAIDAAASEFNKENETKRAKASKKNVQFKTANLLKVAAKKVIEARAKEEDISSKKLSFADVTYKATKNQKAREDSFVSFAETLQLSEARKMLFEGEHPMSITPRFVQFMEDKYPDSPALKLLYEKQLKTELDRAVIGRQASKETIVNLAEKLSPGAINDVRISGEPILTYVALNNPGIIDRVSSIDGISAASKKEALIAVANRSRDRSDYNAAVDLIVSGAQAKVDELTRSTDASPAQANHIANLVTISSSPHGDIRKLKQTMNQEVSDIDKKRKDLEHRDNRKTVRKDTIAGAKVIGSGLGAAAIGTAGLVAAPFILAGAGALKLNEHLSEKKYMKRGAAFLGKNIVKGALHSPQAIAAAVSLTVGSAAVAIYYNSATISNKAIQSLGHAKGALHSPVELARRVDLSLELNKSDKFMQNMITKEFKELYEEGKKEITVDKKDKKAYEAAKNALKKDLDIRKEALKDELKEQNSRHQERIKALIQEKFIDPHTGLMIRDNKQREEIIQNELRIIAGEKLAFFDELYRGQSNYESIKRQEAILEENKHSPVKNLDDLGDRLRGKGSNRDTVEEFISRFDNVGDALKAMENNIKIQGARHKDYEILANESHKVTEKAMAATKSMATGVSRAIDNSTTASLVEASYQTQWDSVKDFAKGVYNTHNIPWEMAKNAVKAKPEVPMASRVMAPISVRAKKYDSDLESVSSSRLSEASLKSHNNSSKTSSRGSSVDDESETRSVYSDDEYNAGLSGFATGFLGNSYPGFDQDIDDDRSVGSNESRGSELTEEALKMRDNSNTARRSVSSMGRWEADSVFSDESESRDSSRSNEPQNKGSNPRRVLQPRGVPMSGFVLPRYRPNNTVMNVSEVGSIDSVPEKAKKVERGGRGGQGGRK